MAPLSILLEKSLASPTNRHSHTSTSANSKLHLAISHARATLYAFIIVAAAAQLVFLNSSSSEAQSAPLFLTPAMWAQLGLAGNMWLLGALLWVMGRTIYLVTQWRERNTSQDEWRRVLWKKEDEYLHFRQEDSEEEVEAS